MKMTIAIVLVILSGLVASLRAHADNGEITRLRWVIVMTITDRTTGTQLKQRELDTELEFDNQRDCELILAKAGPIVPPGDNLGVVLTCREVTRI